MSRVPWFDSRLQDFFWNYDNNGLKNAQSRFYPVYFRPVTNPKTWGAPAARRGLPGKILAA